ncbi:MAG: hypothetical protein HKN74_11710 [Acidimicrobiia bacterium]|nr:hypothetical protein [Acidimicrobiia bacterium]MBT8216700.1 hypothetical protein [Acidimicrobiia bacterium]NNF10943.1 hypothetical protein [Acidimicrobiia bacterium]NNL69379.1 hypothetical protein [Acidimicrobiia bacterium]
MSAAVALGAGAAAAQEGSDLPEETKPTLLDTVDVGELSTIGDLEQVVVQTQVDGEVDSPFDSVSGDSELSDSVPSEESPESLESPESAESPDSVESADSPDSPDSELSLDSEV